MCLGLGNGYVPKEEKKTVSLLKRKTNNDRINEMSIEEKAAVMSCACNVCVYTKEDCISHERCCSDGVKKWLESEAEE